MYIAGLRFELQTPESASNRVIELVNSNSAAHVHLANAYTVSIADKCPEYRDTLLRGIVFPDGKPISWFSCFYRQKPSLKQVRGPQLFLDVLDKGRQAGLKHFFLGDTDQTLELMRMRLVERFEGIEISGCYSPPFRPLTESEIEAQDELIHKSGATIIWVGLGTPKQDIEVARLSRVLQTPAIAVGAAFAFAAGTLQPAPRWMQNLGLEWLFRLLSEPERLWRRYFFGNSRFIWATLRRPHS